MRIEGLRKVTIQEAKEYAAQGYKLAVRTSGQRILTKKFEGSEKLGLIFITLAKTFFTLGILPLFSEKTQDQWKALFSGKISIIPDQKFFETEAGKTALKTHDQGLQLGGNGKSPGGKDLPKAHYLLYADQRANGKQLTVEEQVLLDDFLKTPLFNWEHRLGNIDKRRKSDINFVELSKRIEERILFLKREIPDFDKRLAERGDSPPESNPILTIKDIELPLDQSIVKVALMSDQELFSLKIQDLRALNKDQFEVVKKRIDELPYTEVSKIIEAAQTPNLGVILENPEVENSVKFEKVKFELNLADFLKFNSDGLRAFAESIDPVFFSLMPLYAIGFFVSEYDFESLKLETPEGQEKFRRMFPEAIDSKTYSKLAKIVSSFTPKQISACCALLPAQLLQEITLEDVDFKQKELRARFDDLFPNVGYYDTSSKISKLSLDQIYDLWNLFDSPRMSYLVDEQIKELDLTKFKENVPKDEERFRGLVIPQDQSEETLEAALNIIRDYIIPNKDHLAPKFRQMILDNKDLFDNLTAKERVDLSS